MEPGRTARFSESLRRFTGQNPPRSAQLYYSLTTKAEKVSLKVLDYAGKTVIEFPTASGEPGLHRIAWNLTAGRQRAGAPEGGVARRGGRGQAPPGRGPRPGATTGPAPAAPEAGEEEPAGEVMMFFGQHVKKTEN